MSFWQRTCARGEVEHRHRPCPRSCWRLYPSVSSLPLLFPSCCPWRLTGKGHSRRFAHGSRHRASISQNKGAACDSLCFRCCLFSFPSPYRTKLCFIGLLLLAVKSPFLRLGLVPASRAIPNCRSWVVKTVVDQVHPEFHSKTSVGVEKCPTSSYNRGFVSSNSFRFVRCDSL